MSKYRDRAKALEQLQKLDDETLRILAEISEKPTAAKKLKSNEVLIKAML